MGTIHFRTPQSLVNDHQIAYDLVLLDEAHHYATGTEWGSLLDEFDGDVLAMSGSVDDAGSDSQRIKERLSNSIGPEIKRYTISEARTDGVIPSFDWEVHYAPYDVVGDDLQKVATRADQAFRDFQTRLTQGELTLKTDRRLRTYDDLRRFSHTKEGNQLKQQDEEFREPGLRDCSHDGPRNGIFRQSWMLSSTSSFNITRQRRWSSSQIAMRKSKNQSLDLTMLLPIQHRSISSLDHKAVQSCVRPSMNSTSPKVLGFFLELVICWEKVSICNTRRWRSTWLLAAVSNQALVQRIGRVLRNPADTPKHAMFYNVVGIAPTDSAAAHREDGKQLPRASSGLLLAWPTVRNTPRICDVDVGRRWCFRESTRRRDTLY